MLAKINVQNCLFGFLSGIGAVVVIEEICNRIVPQLSWGSNLCTICNIYICIKYNDSCDYCAKDVGEELNNEDKDNNGTEC